MAGEAELSVTQWIGDLKAGDGGEAARLRHLFAALTDESLRAAALLRMEGYAVEVIAEALDVSPRSVERKPELIRKAWRREDGL